MKMKLLYCFILIANTLYSRSIYIMKYKFYDSNIEMNAFIVRESTGNGFFRVAYTLNDKYCVVEMQFIEQITNQFDQETNKPFKALTFIAGTPKIIQNAQNYSPDNLWFKKYENETTFNSWGVVSPLGNGKYSQGKILEVKLITEDNISESIVSQFFAKSEKIYQTLIGSNNIEFDKTVTFHIIAIGNTFDVKIGKSCQTDLDNFKNTFTEMADFLGAKLDYHTLTEEDFNKKSFIQEIDELQSDENDIIVIYYSGHGFRYSNDQGAYPRIDLRHHQYEYIDESNSIKLSSILDNYLISTKKARLKIVIGDCCNADIGISRNSFDYLASTDRSNNIWSKEKCRKLFIETNGNIIIAAAAKNQKALGYPTIGGVFTNSFLSSLENELTIFNENTPSWTNILNSTYYKTKQLSTQSNCGDSNCMFNPIFWKSF